MTNENDWVTQDVVPRRVAIDEYRWITKQGYECSWGMTLLSPKDREELSHGHIDEYGSRLEVRCKRKDHPNLGKVGSRFITQQELNASPKTRAWTFGKPSQTGHFLISHRDPAIEPTEVTAATVVSEPSSPLWFIYLGQTSDFADPVVPKAKYTLLTDPKEPNGAWLRRPDEIQDALNKGWLFVTEREFEVPEWDR
jgi:hypothetical protein